MAPDPSDAVSYLDGDFLPLSEARVHPLDRGFVFGDGLYEVVKVIGGEVVLWDEHAERLERGLEVVRIRLPGGRRELARICAELLERGGFHAPGSGAGDGSVYLQVTRGAGPREKVPPTEWRPTVFAFARRHAHDGPAARPLAAVTYPDLRWGRCDVKTVSMMATVLGKLAVRDAGADEVLFVADGDIVREGGSTAFLVVQDGALRTHPQDHHVLPSVTRAALAAVAREAGVAVVEEAPRLSERGRWQEAILCGTLTGVQPVASLDGEPLPTGPLARRLGEACAAFEREHRTRLG
ncbi:MAG TPA: aminotransferase class IV [Thermoanaerobaculia bacterium]|nr:aminotransferase class IV [Thermoanaerobaculia bacterium]